MLKHRILTGGGFLALVAALYIWAPTWVLATVVTLTSLLATMEMVQLMRTAGFPALKWTAIGVVLFWMIGAWFAEIDMRGWQELRYVMPVLSVWVVFLGCLFRSDQSHSMMKLTGTFITIAYIAGLMQFILMMLFLGRNGEDGRSLLLYGILVIKSTDMGAYFVGSAIGKHKLIPAISPGKTWEGVLGGVLVATLVSILVLNLYGFVVSDFHFTWIEGVGLGLGLGILGIIGDLVESMLKRSAGIKDSGAWLKGMGGILDVLDSLIFALPLLYIYVSYGLNGL